MENKLTEILQTLQKMIGFHRQLLDLMRSERDVLIQADIQAIQTVTQNKQSILENIRRLEIDRQKLIAELASIWKKPARDLSLANIIHLIQGENLKLADQLRSASTALTVLIQRISEQNQSNATLVEQSLHHISEMKKNVLGEAVPHTDVYNPQGQKSGGMPGARLISKEA